jgi:hypothetical protein
VHYVEWQLHRHLPRKVCAFELAFDLAFALHFSDCRRSAAASDIGARFRFH